MSTPMTYTYDLGPRTPDPVIVSKLRLAMGDTDLTQTTTPPFSTAFSDQEYDSFWQDNGSPPPTDLALVVYTALMSLANDKARLASFVQLQGGGSVDLRQVAAELRAQAAMIRSNYLAQPAEAYAEQNLNDFTWRQLIWTQSLRAAVNTSGPVGP